jgi:hypothetical protein
MLEKQFKEEKPSKNLSDAEEGDVEMATSMAASVMSMPEMVQALVKQTQNAKPEMAVAQYLAEAMMSLAEQSEQNGMSFSPNVWMSNGGVADRLVDQAILNIVAGGGPDLEGSEDVIMGEILEIMKMMSKGGQPQEQQPVPAPAGAPGMPANPGVPRPGVM